MSDFYTVNELAKLFCVNPKTIYRRLWARGIPAFKVGRIWKDLEEGYCLAEEVKKFHIYPVGVPKRFCGRQHE